jgi:hypothetical protein
MKSLTLSCLLLLCLSSCTAEKGAADASGSTAVQQPPSAASWKSQAISRQVSRVEDIMKDRQAPIQHQQLALAVSSLVEGCVLDQAGNSEGRSMEEVEVRCAHFLVNQSLINAGADHAYAVSLAAKSIDPDWFVKIVPTYFDVD